MPVLRRLRWGEVPYGNLRFRNGPHNRLRWKCGNETADPAFRKFDCNWVGNWIYPGSLKPRREKLITPMNKDEWIDSVELTEVRVPSLLSQGNLINRVCKGSTTCSFGTARGGGIYSDGYKGCAAAAFCTAAMKLKAGKLIGRALYQSLEAFGQPHPCDLS